MKIINHEGKELEVFSTAEFEGRTYFILEDARDMNDSSGFYFEAKAVDDNGIKYLVRWDTDNAEANELEDCVSDWEKLSDAIEFDWDE